MGPFGAPGTVLFQPRSMSPSAARGNREAQTKERLFLLWREGTLSAGFEVVAMLRVGILLWSGRIALALAIGAPPCWAQEVTFEDLQGVTIQMRIVAKQSGRNKYGPFSGTVERNVTVVIGPGDQISNTYFGIWHGSRGSIPSRTLRSTRRLEQPAPVTTTGPGEMVWSFTEQTLTRLEIYKGGGGFIRKIVFARNAKGINCAVEDAFVRERGGGPIALDSPYDSGAIQIISDKQISSSCGISKH
jgi:hypothetical protein